MCAVHWYPVYVFALVVGPGPLYDLGKGYEFTRPTARGFRCPLKAVDHGADHAHYVNEFMSIGSYIALVQRSPNIIGPGGIDHVVFWTDIKKGYQWHIGW